MTASITRSECEEIVARLWPHLDGALPETERDRVVTHLAGCAGCRSHYNFAQAFLDAVHVAAPADDDTAFLRIRRRVEHALVSAQGSGE